MTDEKLEQLLHQALTPSVDDADIFVNPPDRRNKMKRIVKSVAAVAACMAFVAAAGKLMQPEHAFTTIVYANENGEDIPLEQGKAVVVNSDGGGYGIEGKTNGLYAYCIDLPLVCEGENIKSVTYRVNEGGFQVIEPPENHVTEGTTCEPIDAGLSVPHGWDNYDITYYSEFTVSGEAQKTGSFVMNLVKEDFAIPNPDLIWGADATAETQSQAIQEMLQDVVITCTVQFEDGSSQEMTLKASAKSQKTEENEMVNLTFLMQ